MIKQKEIVEVANRKQVPKMTVDKDWVLGHFLNAMYSFTDVRDNFVFKGGTCLHKCFIKDYRFSEDLDFTLLDATFDVNKPFINKLMKKASDDSGIKFHLADLHFQQSGNIPQGYKAVIKFWGADHSPNQRPLPASRWQTSIIIDISFSEKLLLPAIEKEISHPYSDAELVKNRAVCYDLTEILSEKIRALKQRNRPRDVYDAWYLTRSTNAAFPGLRELLLKKSELKGLRILGVQDFVNEEKALRNKIAWDQNLS
ncbi:MAG: nucleotidyl transferase AbiEii/AbiGii toxin family protein, partial [Bacteroidetes bacterium]|nr:nucleotidyl transferase AbiEii/AbiGii toxin family protein [Bacteroidota bacterium]